MLKNALCSICLSINKRTNNIYKTDLQYVYENLANLKIRDNECWICYICHTRLQQCHRLKQLVVQTRGLIYDMFQNKINIKLGAFGSLLELSTSRTKIFSTTHPHIKQESDGETEFYYENSALHNEIVENTNTKIISTAPHTSYIKLESDVKTEYCSDDDGVPDEIFDNTNDYAKACDSMIQKLSNVNEKVALQTHGDVDDGGEQKRGKQSMGEHAEIKQEIEVEIENRGIERVDEQDNTNDCEGRDHAGEAQSGRSKEPLSCDFCLKKFSFKSKLLNHMRVHTGEKPFSCDICMNSFSHKCHLIIHIRTHTGERPFSCDICPKKFSQKRYLDEHVAGHTGHKSFGCDICSKTFSRKNNLNTHMRTHTQNTPFVCEVCSKKFTQSNHLDTHMRIHTGVKPYSCHVCSKKFSRTSSLNIHKLIHTRDKTFSCDICSKKFLRKGHLTDHLQTHRGDQPHSCHICLKKFSRRSTLIRHTKNHCGEKA